MIGFSTMTTLQFTRRCVKQFLTQKSITEMGHLPCSSDLALNDFRLFPKIKSALMVRRFQDTEDAPGKSDDSSEGYSTTEVPKLFPTVATSLG
jgi:hypothetical protein